LVPWFWRKSQKCKSLQTDRQTDAGQQAIRKAHLSFQLRWAKKEKKMHCTKHMCIVISFSLAKGDDLQCFSVHPWRMKPTFIELTTAHFPMVTADASWTCKQLQIVTSQAYLYNLTQRWTCLCIVTSNNGEKSNNSLIGGASKIQQKSAWSAKGEQRNTVDRHLWPAKMRYKFPSIFVFHDLYLRTMIWSFAQNDKSFLSMIEHCCVCTLTMYQFKTCSRNWKL
jgi:hypothetical protein